jgi:hypothetical protein
MNQDVYKRNEAIRLFPFFPLDKRVLLHNYLIKIPKYVEFNDDNREMPSILFKDTRNTELNLIIHWFIVNGINQDILPKIYNAIYDGMLKLEPDINNMVVTDTIAELIQPPLANAFENEGSKNGLPVAIQVAKPLGGKSRKNKRGKNKKSKGNKNKRNKSKSKRNKSKSK